MVVRHGAAIPATKEGGHCVPYCSLNQTSFPLRACCMMHSDKDDTISIWSETRANAVRRSLNSMECSDPGALVA